MVPRPHHHHDFYRPGYYYRTGEQVEQVQTVREGVEPATGQVPDQQTTTNSILIPVVFLPNITSFPYQNVPYIINYHQQQQQQEQAKVDEAEGDVPSVKDANRPIKGTQIVGGLLGATAGYVLASSLLNNGVGNNGNYYGNGYSNYRPSYYNSYQAYRPYDSYYASSGDNFRNLPQETGQLSSSLEAIVEPAKLNRNQNLVNTFPISDQQLNANNQNTAK